MVDFIRHAFPSLFQLFANIERFLILFIIQCHLDACGMIIDEIGPRHKGDVAVNTAIYLAPTLTSSLFRFLDIEHVLPDYREETIRMNQPVTTVLFYRVIISPVAIRQYDRKNGVHVALAQGIHCLFSGRDLSYILGDINTTVTVV